MIQKLPPNIRKIIDKNTDYATINAIVETNLERLGYPVMVKVLEVNSSLGIAGFVDVQPLIGQQDANGIPYPMGTIFNVPYVRIQGGANALIIDPQVGDIGLILILGRDHTHFINNRTQHPDQDPQQAPQASYRIFSLSDAIYLGGVLNKTPLNFIEFKSDGTINITTTKQVNISATKIEANCDIHTSGNIKADGDVTAGSISLKNHTHSNGHNGAPTGPPQ